MPVNLGDLLLGVKVDTAALKKVRTELSKLESEASKVKLGVDAKGAAKASVEVKTLKEEVTKLSKQTSKLEIENKALKRSYSSVATGAAKASAGAVKYAKGMKGAAKATDATQEALNRTAKTIQLVQGPLGGLASRFVTFKAILKDNTLGVAAFTLAMAGLSTTLVKAFKSFVDTETSLVKLDNTLTATGRNFETTLGSMDKAAERLARRTLLSLQEAREGIGQALTFTNIPTDEIERFANVAADVAAGLNKDFKGSVTSIAKALQAPASALDGLGRAGQFFTKGQRQVLQSLVDTGQQAKATGIILDTLEQRFANIGTAKGISGALDSLEIDVQLFRESIFTTTSAAGDFANAVNRVGSVLRSFTGEQSLATKLGDELSAGLRKVSASLDFLVRNAGALKVVFKALAFSLIANKITSLINPLIGVTLGFSKAATASGRFNKNLVTLKRAGKFLLGGALLFAAEQLNDAFFGTAGKVKGLSSLFITLKAVASVSINGLKMILIGLREVALGVFNDMKGVVSSFGTDLSSGLGKSFSEVLRDVTAFGAIFVNQGVKIFKGFATVATTFISSMFQGIKEVFNGILDLGSAASKIFSGNFELAGKEASEALRKIGANNPFSTLVAAGENSATALKEVLGAEGLIDVDAVAAKAYQFGEEGGSAFSDAFKGTLLGGASQTLDSFGKLVTEERQKMLDAIPDSAGSPILNKNAVEQLSPAAKKLKEIRDLAQQLSFDIPAEEADLLNGQITELKRKLAFLTDKKNQIDLGFKPTTKEVEAFKGKISQLEKELLAVNREPFEKLAKSGPKLQKVQLEIKAIGDELQRIADKGLEGLDISSGEVSFLKDMQADLKKEAFDLANPFIAGVNEGIDTLGGEVSDNLAARIFGEDDTSYRDIAKKFVKGMLSEMIQTVIMDKLAADLKGAFGSMFDALGATKKEGMSASEASGAAEGGLAGPLVAALKGGTSEDAGGTDSAVAALTEAKTQTQALQGVGDSVAALAASNQEGFGGLGGVFTSLFNTLLTTLIGGQGADAASGFLGGIGAMFGGARANGGPVSPSKAFLVGEEGPELFMPKRSGDILNSRQTAKANQTASNDNRSVVFNITTPDAQSFQYARSQMESQARQILRNN